MEPEAIHEHHETPYFTDFDAQQEDSLSEASSNEYYEGLIGQGAQNHYDLVDDSSEEPLSNESYDPSNLSFSSDNDPNDILFNINDDLQFKLDTEDNYEGRDVDIGIVMPGGTGSGGVSKDT